MITQTEVLTDLRNVYKKVKIITNTYKNEVWNNVELELRNLIKTVENDKRIYSW